MKTKDNYIKMLIKLSNTASEYIENSSYYNTECIDGGILGNPKGNSRYILKGNPRCNHIPKYDDSDDLHKLSSNLLEDIIIYICRKLLPTYPNIYGNHYLRDISSLMLTSKYYYNILKNFSHIYHTSLNGEIYVVISELNPLYKINITISDVPFYYNFSYFSIEKGIQKGIAKYKHKIDNIDEPRKLILDEYQKMRYEEYVGKQICEINPDNLYVVIFNKIYENIQSHIPKILLRYICNLKKIKSSNEFRKIDHIDHLGIMKVEAGIPWVIFRR